MDHTLPLAPSLSCSDLPWKYMSSLFPLRKAAKTEGFELKYLNCSLLLFYVNDLESRCVATLGIY